MNAATGTTSPLYPHLRKLIVAALLTLTLFAGVGATTTQVAAKPRGIMKQPAVVCMYFTQEEWIMVAGEDPGPGGYWNCILKSEQDKRAAG